MEERGQGVAIVDASLFVQASLLNRWEWRMPDGSSPGHRQRLKEAFMAGDESALAEEVLLELLLTYSIPQKDVQPLAMNLISQFGSLENVLAADSDNLCQFKGLQFHSSTLLKLAHVIRMRTNPMIEAERTGKSESRKAQTTLFDINVTEPQNQEPSIVEEEKTQPAKSVVRRGTGLFSKALLKETMALLPQLPETESLAEVREFVRKNLHFNSETTRIRFGDYIVRRMFSHGYADRAIRRFAIAFAGRQELRDVCFFRFCKAEPLMYSVLEDLAFPVIGAGRIERSCLTEYLSRRFPAAKNVISCSQAIADAFAACSVGRVDKAKLSFSYRDIPIPSFAFVLHSEFPEPGMYDIAKIEQNPSIRAMLWRPEQITHALYELRNLGLLAKVSEIDRIRQFTTKWTLEEAVERIIAG